MYLVLPEPLALSVLYFPIHPCSVLIHGADNPRPGLAQEDALVKSVVQINDAGGFTILGIFDFRQVANEKLVAMFFVAAYFF